MKKTIKHITPWLAAAAVGGMLLLAPVASAATYTAPNQSNQIDTDSGGNPLVPDGTSSSGSVLPYNDAGNTQQQAGAV